MEFIYTIKRKMSAKKTIIVISSGLVVIGTTLLIIHLNNKKKATTTTTSTATATQKAAALENYNKATTPQQISDALQVLAKLSPNTGLPSAGAAIPKKT
jgi:predicted signal transduction protein with EAL and GGDEF domain